MIWYCYDLGTNVLVLSGHRSVLVRALRFGRPLVRRTSGARMISTIVLLLALPAMGQGCPHEGADHRLLGRVGCQIQRKMTIERARPPRTIWSFHVLKLSVKVDPRHPHLLMEWPARSQRLWRFRLGYRWDANAKAYIFPALALKKVDGPMAEYERKMRRQSEPKTQTPAADGGESLSKSQLSTIDAMPRRIGATVLFSTERFDL
jgi:hypothetical protein